MLGLNEKVVLITGVTGTLGSATAQVFANNGAKLTLTGRDPYKLSQVTKRLNYADCVPQSCNLIDEQEVKQLIQTALDKFGRIDCSTECRWWI